MLKNWMGIFFYIGRASGQVCTVCRYVDMNIVYRYRTDRRVPVTLATPGCDTVTINVTDRAYLPIAVSSLPP